MTVGLNLAEMQRVEREAPLRHAMSKTGQVVHLDLRGNLLASVPDPLIDSVAIDRFTPYQPPMLKQGKRRGR